MVAMATHAGMAMTLVLIGAHPAMADLAAAHRKRRPRGESDLEEQRTAGNYNLTLFATFKSEGKILREWVMHYVSEGVDHFVLVDNTPVSAYEALGSEDDSCQLDTFIE